MKKYGAFLIIALLVPDALIAQMLSIPDPHFLSALIEAGVDKDGSGTIEQDEAAEVKCLDLSDRFIHDLDGIEAFTSLTELDCSRNFLTELDLSGNKSLKILCCAVNWLESLDLTGNPELTDLICCFNNLTGVDLSANPTLRYLDCSANRLGSLDVSRNPELEYLDCHDTRLEILLLKHNPMLKYLNCSFNYLKRLELSENSCLNQVDCRFNGLSELDVSGNRDLISLICYCNRITRLNLSKNARLEELYCGYNQLSELDISANPGIRKLGISGMKSLTSLCVPAIPFPPEGVIVYSDGSPNIVVIDCQPPRLDFSYLQYDPLLIEVCISEQGTIYVVTEGTGKDSALICENCICSAEMAANVSRNIPVTGTLEEGYWIYAMDRSGNISEPLPLQSHLTGIRKDLEERVIIYPNPFGGILNIASQWPGKTEISITDISAEIFIGTIMEGGTLELDLSTLPPGTYLLSLKSDQGVTVRKIVKF